ncbi:MAG: hypothetical protein JNG84_15205 [Archangium sp.]|nr:hypothetical protein [Archangium sp.]
MKRLVLGLVALVACSPGALDVKAMNFVSWTRPKDAGVPTAYALRVLDDRVYVRTADALESYRLNGGTPIFEKLVFVKDASANPAIPNFMAAKPGLVVFGDGSRVILVDVPAMTQIGELDLGSANVGELHFDGDWLYIGLYADGVKRVNLATPTAPGALETITTLDAYRLLVGTQHLYLANSGAIQIVTKEPNATELGSAYTGRLGELALYQGRWLYGSIGPARELAVIDVLDPAAPRVVKSGDDQSNGTGLALVGNQLLATDLEGRLQVFELADPERPVLQGTLSMLDDTGARAACGTTCSGATFGMATSGNLVMIGGLSGFAVFRR